MAWIKLICTTDKAKSKTQDLKSKKICKMPTCTKEIQKWRINHNNKSNCKTQICMKEKPKEEGKKERRNYKMQKWYRDLKRNRVFLDNLTKSLQHSKLWKTSWLRIEKKIRKRIKPNKNSLSKDLFLRLTWEKGNAKIQI